MPAGLGDPGTDDVFYSGSSTPSLSLPLASVNQWQVIGGVDELTVDFSNGDPLPAGGLVYSGGTYVTHGNLIIQGTSGDDAALANADGIALDGSAPITYSNVQAFAFNLGPGQDGLTVDGITLPNDGTLSISTGTAVTVQGSGTLDLCGNTCTAGNLTLTRAASPTARGWAPARRSFRAARSVPGWRGPAAY